MNIKEFKEEVSKIVVSKEFYTEGGLFEVQQFITDVPKLLSLVGELEEQSDHYLVTIERNGEENIVLVSDKMVEVLIVENIEGVIKGSVVTNVERMEE